MPRSDTQIRRPVGSTQADLLKSLARISGEVRAIGAGVQANDLDEVLDKLTDVLKTPRLEDVFKQLAHPHSWPTREYALWMAKELQRGAQIMDELIPDAEITGSVELAVLGRDWIDGLGLRKLR